MEVVESVIFSRLVVNLAARSENALKQSGLLRFPVKCGHRSGERLWQLGSSDNIVMKICRVGAVCQMLLCRRVFSLQNCG